MFFCPEIRRFVVTVVVRAVHAFGGHPYLSPKTVENFCASGLPVLRRCSISNQTALNLDVSHCADINSPATQRCGLISNRPDSRERNFTDTTTDVSARARGGAVSTYGCSTPNRPVVMYIFAVP